MTDHRQWLRSKLERYAQRYALILEETEKENKIRTFLDQNENCFDRSNLYGHITGSAWITNESFDSFLLIHHRKLGLWLQLGGHADGESNILNVALREAEEESGLKSFKVLSEEIFDLDIHLIPARPHEPEHFHFDIRFLLQASFILPLYRNERESLELAWVSIEDIRSKDLYKDVRRMAEKSMEVMRSINPAKPISLQSL